MVRKSKKAKLCELCQRCQKHRTNSVFYSLNSLFPVADDTRILYFYLFYIFTLKSIPPVNNIEIMNADMERNNVIHYEIQEPDYWNISYTTSNRILSKRKLARFIASLICQTQEIENKMKLIAEQKYISVKDEESIRTSCRLYDEMLVLIQEWRNLHCLSDRKFKNVNSWNQHIYKSPDQNEKLNIK